MAYHRGTEIIVASNPRGVFLEGTVSGTPRPGTIMQIDVNGGATTATSILGTGRFTFEVFAATDGLRPVGPLCILLPAPGMGSSVWSLNTTAYASTTTEYIYGAYVDGEHCHVYIPVAGEEFNLLVEDVSGTADVSSGTVFIVDSGTGLLKATTGVVEVEPFICLSDFAQPADASDSALVHMMYSGY